MDDFIDLTPDADVLDAIGQHAYDQLMESAECDPLHTL